MTVALRDEGRIIGIEAEDIGFVCANCLSEAEDARLDTFRQAEAEYRDYECVRCGKRVPAPPGTYLAL